MPWEAISYVTSGLSLTAFVAALVAWLVRQKMNRERDLIERAPDEDRADLVMAALEFFKVDTRDLSEDRQYNIAITQINNRAKRFTTLCIVVVILAVILAIATVRVLAMSDVGEEIADTTEGIQEGVEDIGEALRIGQAPLIEDRITGVWGESGCGVTYRFSYEDETLTVTVVNNPRVDFTEPWIFVKNGSETIATTDGSEKSVLRTVERHGPIEATQGTLVEFTFTDFGQIEDLVWATSSPLAAPTELVRCDDA